MTWGGSEVIKIANGDGVIMGKKNKDKKGHDLAVQRRIAELAKNRTTDRGKLLLAVTLLWLLGLILIVARYGKLW